jgi:hypothetical protein
MDGLEKVSGRRGRAITTALMSGICLKTPQVPPRPESGAVRLGLADAARRCWRRSLGVGERAETHKAG